ncbi:Zn-dependent peptidase ImmA (M78 family) [Evansella vedderi]|uniref:Zn-dependent peptidase ImmA (M78 family) n=1 Tax=Evansella vedderi TaxID=38282 RepID=A0ABT9ZXN8_9BACI|nr:ImmA/IrrE family metallo-endopeptidase [Evansella vedderi]MDQ0254890.1 Zn-dependent peptidase ImmA (M78 family) [Evansella vedderi]
MELIKKKIYLLTRKFNTNCPFKIADEMGIQVLHEPLGDTLGYYSKHFRIKFIHINEAVNDKKKQFICAHELGHAVLHPDVNTPFLKKHTLFSTDRIEVEANTFAVKLLFHNGIEESVTINEAVEEYGVPKRLLKSLG